MTKEYLSLLAVPEGVILKTSHLCSEWCRSGQYYDIYPNPDTKNTQYSGEEGFPS